MRLMTGDPGKVHAHPSATHTPFYVRPAVRPDTEPDAIDALRDRLADRTEAFVIAARARFAGLQRRLWHPLDGLPVRFLWRRLRAFRRDFDSAMWHEDRPDLERALKIAVAVIVALVVVRIIR